MKNILLVMFLVSSCSRHQHDLGTANYAHFRAAPSLAHSEYAVDVIGSDEGAILVFTTIPTSKQSEATVRQIDLSASSEAKVMAIMNSLMHARQSGQHCIDGTQYAILVQDGAQAEVNATDSCNVEAQQAAGRLNDLARSVFGAAVPTSRNWFPESSQNLE